MSANVIDPVEATFVGAATDEFNESSAAAVAARAEDEADLRADVRNETTTVIHRDPDDVRLILRLALAGIVLSALLVTSVGANVLFYWQGPMMIFKIPETGRVLQVNNTVFGTTEPVRYGQDRLTDDDKLYCARRHSHYRFAVDPATRAGDLEKMFKMMVPQTAVALFELMKRTKELERQAAEKQQAVWTPQVMRVNSFDPYKVDIIGTQTVTRVVAGGNTTRTESKQISFSLKLVADPQRRADRNERSGFVIADVIDYREFGAAAAAGEAGGLLAAPTPAQQTPQEDAAATTPVTGTQQQ